MKEQYKAIRVDLRLYYKATGGPSPQQMSAAIKETTEPVQPIKTV